MPRRQPETKTLYIILLYILDTTMVFCSLMPYFLALFIVIVAIARRRKHFISLFVILLAQYVICHILKTLIRQRRPSISCSRDLSFGMPSQHASFTVALTLWFILKRVKAEGTSAP